MSQCRHYVMCGLVCVQGKARPDGSPKDIDKEFVLMYSIAHERKSFFALGNYLKFLPQLVNTLPKKRALVDELAGDDSDDYEDLYYMINGAPRSKTHLLFRKFRDTVCLTPCPAMPAGL